MDRVLIKIIWIGKDYHPGYYAAFVLDPDGHNIEALYRAWLFEK